MTTEDFGSKLEQLKQLLRESRHALAFTGAGISTLSGIRDFRGKEGVYLQPWRGHRVEEILSLRCFLAHPELFYAWAKEFIYQLEEFHPSVVHTSLAKLEWEGVLKGIYTQNIDLLHQRAGSRRVKELHGSSAMHHCLRCGAANPYAEIAPKVLADEVPHCGCGGLIKPDIVFYGENLNEELLEEAFDEMQRTDLLIVAGSSLTVHPAADLPLEAVRYSAKLVIVNDQPTPLDRYAALRFPDLKELFSQL